MEQYVDIYRTLSEGISHDRDSLNRFKNEKLQRFIENGLPTKKVEKWRHFDMSDIKDCEYSISQNKIGGSSLPIDGYEKIAVVNGNGNNTSGDLLGLVGTIEKDSSHVTDLNGAIFDSVTTLSLKDNDKVEVDYTVVGSESVVANRTIIVVEENQNVELIEYYASDNGEDSFVNSVTEIIVKKGATLSHTVIQSENKTTTHLGTIFVSVEENAVYNGVTISTGSKKDRYETHVYLNGEGAGCDVRGLFAGNGERIHNGDVTIHHIAPNCTSNSLFRGIVNGNSTGIFRGLVHIYEGATKSDSNQGFHSLILNDDASIKTEPHLLVFNDDVAATHGATVGRLDDLQLFYLESRGLTPADAKKILIQSFAADTVTLLDGDVKNYLLELIHDEVKAVAE